MRYVEIDYLGKKIEMEKVLLLNGGHSEMTMITELKKLGKHVITTGNLPNSFVHKLADEYVQADYSDMNRVLEIAKEKQVSGVVSCANDFGIITAAYVSEKLGFKGHDPYDITCMLHQKDRFKEFAIDNKLLVPMSLQFSGENEAISSINEFSFPVIIKPADLTSGMGVTKVHSVEEYIVAVKKAFDISRKKKIIIEQFIEGTYHSFSTFLVNKKVVGFYSDNEYSFVYPYFIDTSAGPANCIDKIQETLIEQAEKVAFLLNLSDGIFHMQYVLDKEKNPYIFDITRRCSGDLYSEPVEYATGIPWTKWIVMSELGFSSESFWERGRQRGYSGRHCIMAETEGIVKDVIIKPQIQQYIYKDLQWWKPGDVIKNHISTRLGILFYDFPTNEVQEAIIPQIKELVKVVIK